MPICNLLVVLNTNNPLKNSLILVLHFLELNMLKRNFFLDEVSVLLLRTKAIPVQFFSLKWYFYLQTGQRLRLQCELTFPGPCSEVIDLDK